MLSRVLGSVLGLLVLAVPTSLATAQGAPVASGNSALGTILVDQHGMTLYTLSSDQPSVSTCAGGCLGLWPAATVDDATADTLRQGAPADWLDLSSFLRDDGGGNQLTWGGMPLYRFSRDAAPGDVTGNGINAFGGTWAVVQLAGQ